MSIIYDVIQKFSNTSEENIRKLMTEIYDLDEETIKYNVSNIHIILNNHMHIRERVFVHSLKRDHVSQLHEKYFGATKLSKCHSKSLDTEKTLTSLIYYDGIEALYNCIKNTIHISVEELVFCLFISFQTGIYENLVKELIKSFEVKK